MSKWIGSLPRVCALALAVSGLTAAPQGLAQNETDNVTVEQLQQELAKRDAVIIELLNRIEALEAESEADGAATGAEPGGLARARQRDSASGASGVSVAASAEEFDLDALRAERALERGLIERGARLLAPGNVELAPRFTFSRDEGMFPVALMVGDADTVGEVERTFERYEVSTEARFGLPLGLQLEIGFPYQWVDRQVETDIDGILRSTTAQSGSGAGDATIGLAKAFGTDNPGGTRWIGRLAWLTGSGDERDGSVFLGGGASSLNVQGTAYWRRDPVVFLMSGAYRHFESDGVLQRGDSVSLSLGLGLAISPESSLIFSLDQTRTSELNNAGMDLAGTDRFASSLGLSAQTLFGERLSLGVNADLGLTDDASDYRLGVSLSSRFDLR